MKKKKKEDEISVKAKCLSRLEQWQKWGVVIDYDDVSALGKHLNSYTMTWFMRTRKGKRDIVAWFKVGKVLWSYFIEVKTLTGVQKPEQIEYEKKWIGLENVIYELVSIPGQIDETLDRLTGRTAKLLKEGERHMFPGIRLKVKRK